jgi:hypothetical protein
MGYPTIPTRDDLEDMGDVATDMMRVLYAAYPVRDVNNTYTALSIFTAMVTKLICTEVHRDEWKLVGEMFGQILRDNINLAYEGHLR